MWSDPDDLENGLWSLSPRGAGFVFGSKICSEFLWLNSLSLVCRAHQLIDEGFKFMFPEETLVTIWSAPNYCGRCGNQASFLFIEDIFDIKDHSFTIFDASPKSIIGKKSKIFTNYFD